MQMEVMPPNFIYQWITNGDQKIVVKVPILCQKCSTIILKIVAKFEGIKSLNIDVEKGTLTVIGNVDPVCIIKALRKKKRGALIVSVGPEEVKKVEPEKNKDDFCKKITECCSQCKPAPYWSHGPAVVLYEENPQYGCIIS